MSNNKDTRERGCGALRGWSALSAKDWGKGILPETVNKQARQAGESLAGAGACTQQPGLGKLLRDWVTRRGGKTHFPQKVKPNITMKRQAATNQRKRKSKKAESNLNVGTHNQTFKQLRQLNDRNHHIPISTNT
jgi:hypothetical protein